MKTFQTGPFRIELVSHERVRGEDFPAPHPLYISDWFRMRAFFNGLPLDLYPNADPHPHPDDRNMLTIGWMGLAERAPGVRGGDFRTHYFRTIYRRLAKARLGQQLGLVIGDLTYEHEAQAPAALRRFLAFTEAPPVRLRDQSIDDAIAFLVDGPVVYSRRIPSGTVVNIDTDFDTVGDRTTSTMLDSNTTVVVQKFTTGNQTFAVWRFPLLFSASAVADVDFQCNVTSENIESTDNVELVAYNLDGAADPDPDDFTTAHGRVIGGGATLLISVTTPFQTTGSKTTDLGTTADGHVLANAGGSYTVAARPGAAMADTEFCVFEAIENAGTDPATLTVDYTEAVNVAPRPQVVMQAVTRGAFF